MTRYQLPEPPAVPSEMPQPGKVPLVWPTGQRGEHLVEHGYTPATSRDHLRVPLATATYAICTFAPRGGTVVDPDCGAGTVLVEGLHCGRHAIGVARGRRWWSLARANLSAAQRQGAATDGMVLPTSRAEDLTGRADLVLTAAWRPPTGLTSSHGSHDSSDGRFSAMLTWSRDVVKPGGYLVVVAQPQRRHGYLLDGPGGTRGGRPPAFEREIHKRRNTVERCINRLKQWRGIATRHEKAATIHLAGLHIAGIFLWSAR